MKKILATAVACVALLSQTAAQAANGCLGCNVADEHVLNSTLIGTTIYFEGTRGVAVQIDRTNLRVYVNLSDGRSGWADAAETYTDASHQERVVAGGIGAFIAFEGLWALFGGSGSSSASSDGSYSSQADAENARFNGWTQKNRDAGLNDNGTPQ